MVYKLFTEADKDFMGYIPKQGGSRFKIKEEDIKRFVIDHAVKLTCRNVDLSMMVYILTGE